MRRLISIFFVVLGFLFVGSAGVLAAEGVEEQRAEIRKASKTALNKLYRANPSTRKFVKSAAGYASFTNFGMKILFAGGGSGSGLAVNNQTGQEVFMKMFELQAGIGLGIKKFSVVFVFETEDALNNFIESGWEFGGQATAAVTNGKGGKAYQGAVSVMPGVWMYQMTNKGLALEATGKATKYYKNDDLN